MVNPNRFRGFDKLIGETIVNIDTTAINVAVVICKSGKRFEVEAAETFHGIPIPELRPIDCWLTGK